MERKNIKGKFDRIGKEVSEALKQVKKIEAIAISGSLIHGFIDKYSDVDMICLCNKIPSNKERNEAIKKLKIDYFVNGDLPEFMIRQSDYFIFKETQVGIYYIELKKYEELVDKFASGGTTAEEVINLIGHIYYTKSLYDPKKVLFNLRNKVKKPNIKNIRYFIYKLNRMINLDGWPYGEKLDVEIARKDYFSTSSLFSELTNDYLICLFVLNGEYYTKSKGVANHLKKFKKKPKDCINKINQLTYLGNNKKSAKKKIKILKYLVDDLNKRVKWKK